MLMQASTSARLINVALRGCALGSKFVLIFFLAKFLEPAELGLYGLVAATIAYAQYFLGLDFYTFSTREILKCRDKSWGGILKSQGALMLVLYILFIPFFFIIFFAGILPWYLAGWILALLVLEHINQEFIRFLVAVSDQLFASVALFLRSGAWAVVIVVLMLFEPGLRNLESVLAAWCIGGGVALSVVVIRLFRLGIGGWRMPVDWAWIWSGIKIALPLLTASLALRGIYTLDRYWLEALGGLEVLGAYVLFVGVAGAMTAFLEAGVFSFSYPSLIRSFQQGRPVEYRRELRRLFSQTLLLSSAFVMVALVLVGPVLRLLGRPLYIAHLGMFFWILLATYLYALSMVPHYALYSQGQDRPIIQSHMASLFLFVLSAWQFSIFWPYIAIPLGLCCAFALMLFWKACAYLKFTPKIYQMARF